MVWAFKESHRTHDPRFIADFPAVVNAKEIPGSGETRCGGDHYRP